MVAVLLKVGPLGKIVRENPELAEAVEPKLRAALAQRGSPALIDLNAAVWIVSAMRPGD